jgi:hypothetical protein
VLHSSALARPSPAVNAYWPVVRVFNARPRSARFDQAYDQKKSRTACLDRYLEGWAEADLGKILDATAAGYRFRDPFVGTFSRQSLHNYFDLLQDRLSRAGAVTRRDLAFSLRGPLDRPSQPGGLQFWREAPQIGLTGIADIEVAYQGVIAENVAYDANLASDMLRRVPQ